MDESNSDDEDVYVAREVLEDSPKIIAGDKEEEAEKVSHDSQGEEDNKDVQASQTRTVRHHRQGQYGITGKDSTAILYMSMNLFKGAELEENSAPTGNRPIG
jgi:hypothetical protein